MSPFAFGLADIFVCLNKCCHQKCNNKEYFGIIIFLKHLWRITWVYILNISTPACYKYRQKWFQKIFLWELYWLYNMFVPNIIRLPQIYLYTWLHTSDIISPLWWNHSFRNRKQINLAKQNIRRFIIKVALCLWQIYYWDKYMFDRNILL